MKRVLIFALISLVLMNCAYASLFDGVITALSGDTLVDNSGNGHNLVLGGGASISTSIYKLGNGSYYFNNAAYGAITNSSNNVANNYTAFSASNVGTFCSWIYVTAADDLDGIFSNLQTGSNGYVAHIASSSGWKLMNRQYDSSSSTATSTNAIPLNAWLPVCVIKDGSLKGRIFVNTTKTAFTHTYSAQTSANNFIIGAWENGGRYLSGYLDEVTIWNRNLSDDEVVSWVNNGTGLQYIYPYLNALTVVEGTLNFTSDGGRVCSFDGSNYVQCGTTEDGTPTVKFATMGNSTCKVWNESKNWTTLSNQGIPDCATTGSSNHICTYSSALPNGTYMIYISCKTELLEINNFAFYPYNQFNITITSPMRVSQSHANDAINSGITNSAIWPGATIYTTQPIYIRIKNNSQAFATFDKVAVYGNQRWAFNFKIENESSIKPFFNITPVFYFWEGENLSYYEVTTQVSTLINTTKN